MVERHRSVSTEAAAAPTATRTRPQRAHRYTGTSASSTRGFQVARVRVGESRWGAHAREEDVEGTVMQQRR
ncbi:hypothetical protein [Eggerthella sinensis]|uniref:hypothetical protein n=1 Tax=Eggerthella sinensis TaxID=242230 RepID=UPI0022E5ACD7|nr:hypothetical protein [Eggerthella sinensis]